MFGLFKKPFDYPLIEPPLKFKPFLEMSKEEADRHFHWFVHESPIRIRLLFDLIKSTRASTKDLDYTPESLVPLWKATSRFMKKETYTRAERKAFYNSLPEQWRQIDFKTERLTTATRGLAIDIGFYIAEVFLRRYPPVKWILWRKKDSVFNRPVLGGFKAPLVPAHAVGACAGKKADGNSDPSLLLNIYNVWAKDLSDS